MEFRSDREFGSSVCFPFRVIAGTLVFIVCRPAWIPDVSSVGLSEGARFHELTYVARLQDEGFVHDEGCLCCSSRRGFSDRRRLMSWRRLLLEDALC